MQTQPMLIFLPVRNGASHIAAAIDSIRNQTNPNWQLIVLENCSTDRTEEIVASYSDHRIKLEAAEISLNIRENWQRAEEYLKQSINGDALVSFIGHDDILAPSFLETILELERAHPLATLYQTHFNLIDQDGRLIRPCRPVPFRESSSDLAAQLGWGLRDSFGTGFAFRARHHLKVGGWPDLPRLLFADHLLFIRLTNLGYKVASPETGAFYRLHAGSASGQLNAAKLKDGLRALAQFVDALQTEMPEFASSDRGRSAVAALLSRELAILRLNVVKRLYCREEREILIHLESILSASDHGLPSIVWSKLHIGPLTELLASAQGALTSFRIWRATR